MALDMFINMGPNIKGESQDAEQEKEGGIDILGWSWGAGQSGTTHMGSGGGGGKASFEDIRFTKFIDRATSSLYIALAKGSHLPECKILVRKAGEGQQKYLEITMKEVLVTSISSGPIGPNDRLTESVSLNFAEIRLEYFIQNKDGTPGPGSVFSWNIAQSKAGGG